jgi:hypothetical protein
MRITRQTGEADLVAFRALLKRLPEGRKHVRLAYTAYLAMMAFAVYLVLFMLLFLRGHDFHQLWMVALAIPLGLALWHPTWLYLDRSADRGFVKVNERELGPQEFWVDSDGFGNGTPAGSTYHRWHTVGDVHETPDLTAVIASPRLYSIPAGEDREEYARFLAEMRRHRESYVAPRS